MVNPSGGLEVSNTLCLPVTTLIPSRQRATHWARQALECTFTSRCSCEGVSAFNTWFARNLTGCEGGGPMQVLGATEKFGLVHNIGLGGAVVCSLLRRPRFYKAGGETGINR